MATDDRPPYRLYAHIGSPYSMKMLGLLRYRRIPHVVAGRMADWAKAFKQVRVPVMPVLEHPDGTFENDSTPLILDLERRHVERSVVPEREVDAFLAALIEDLADEWLSKAMYAYRWAFPGHTKWTGRLIAFDQHFGGGIENLERAGHDFATRQVGRNELVGCTEANLPMLMEIANRVLDALEPSIPIAPSSSGADLRTPTSRSSDSSASSRSTSRRSLPVRSGLRKRCDGASTCTTSPGTKASGDAGKKK